MNTAEGRGKIFRVAKQMRKDRRDVEGTNFMKSDTGEIKIEATEVCGRWRKYFDVLLYGENEGEFDVVENGREVHHGRHLCHSTAAGEIPREKTEVVPHICESGKGFR